MLEYLISEEEDKAKEIFHQLVVEKSREIYETILAEDFQQDEEVDESKDEDEDEDQVDESSDDEEVDENYSFEGNDEEDEAEGGEDDGDVGGDATDDFMSDLEDGDDDSEGGEGDMEDRVMDLEDALDDLRAEFETMMGGDNDEMGMDDMDDMGGDDMGMDMDEPVKDSFDVSDNFMREYIEKVTNPKHGDDGVNNQSIVAKANNMGGTTANIAKGGEAKGEGTKGGLANPASKEENFGNVNVPGGTNAKQFYKKNSAGHGAERKGSGDNGDKSAGSPINGAPKRAK